MVVVVLGLALVLGWVWTAGREGGCRCVGVLREWMGMAACGFEGMVCVVIGWGEAELVWCLDARMPIWGRRVRLLPGMRHQS